MKIGVITAHGCDHVNGSVAIVIPIVTYLWLNTLVNAWPPDPKHIADLNAVAAVQEVALGIIDVFAADLSVVDHAQTSLINNTVAIIVDIITQFKLRLGRIAVNPTATLTHLYTNAADCLTWLVNILIDGAITIVVEVITHFVLRHHRIKTFDVPSHAIVHSIGAEAPIIIATYPLV
jgi:hypothetical protein